MTSKVTVQAHNSGRVRVTLVDPQASDKEVRVETLEPSTSCDFYIHSNAKLIAEEIPNPGQGENDPVPVDGATGDDKPATSQE